MEIEHDFKVLPIDEHLEAKVKAMIADGWNIVAGFQPIAIYPLQRVKQAQQQPGQDDGGFGINPRLTINDEGVGILRNGQLIKN